MRPADGRSRAWQTGQSCENSTIPFALSAAAGHVCRDVRQDTRHAPLYRVRHVDQVSTTMGLQLVGVALFLHTRATRGNRSHRRIGLSRGIGDADEISTTSREGGTVNVTVPFQDRGHGMTTERHAMTFFCALNTLGSAAVTAFHGPGVGMGGDPASGPPP